MRRTPMTRTRVPHARLRDRRRLAAGLAALVTLGVLAPAGVAAQLPGGHIPGQPPRDPAAGGNGTQWDMGGALSAMVPQGPFGSFVEDGFGGVVTALLGFADSPAFRVRFEAGFIEHGSEALDFPVFSVTDRIMTEIVTRNNVGYLGLGPEIRFPRGPVQPFVNGFAGLGYFFTVSSVEGETAYGGTTVNFDDVRVAYGYGGGFAIPVVRSAMKPVVLRLEAQYRRHGRTEYLVPGSIVEDGTGGTFLSPIASDVDFLLLQVGVTFRL